MLETLEGKQVTRVPHRADFDALIARLGAPTAEAIHDYLDSVIDNLPVRDNGLRTFGSSQLGHDLTPWPEPLDRLYHHAWEFLGDDAREDDVQLQAALWFGLFVWQRIMERDESWVFYNPNLSATDPNREPLGKVYFERANAEA